MYPILLLLSLLALSADASPRIIGGQPASIKNWPFMAAITLRADPDNYRGMICGGTLIRPRVVLSAAHCLFGSPVRDFQVLQGRRDLRKKGGTASPVLRIAIHPSYRPSRESYDLALLRLKKPLPGYLPALETNVPEEGLFRTAGWGWIGDRYSPILRQVVIPRVSDKDCQQEYSYSFESTNMFCAGSPNKDTCTNDSGGPVVAEGSLVGVVSWGDSDCGSAPGVYARIQKPWIQKVLQKWKAG